MILRGRSHNSAKGHLVVDDDDDDEYSEMRSYLKNMLSGTESEKNENDTASSVFLASGTFYLEHGYGKPLSFASFGIEQSIDSGNTKQFDSDFIEEASNAFDLKLVNDWHVEFQFTDEIGSGTLKNSFAHNHRFVCVCLGERERGKKREKLMELHVCV